MASDDILAINQHALLLGQMLWEDGRGTRGLLAQQQVLVTEMGQTQA